jgi:aldehyde:ferredoxin oxidoreductase
MKRILRVDVGAGTAKFEDMPAKYDTLGGRALIAAVALDEIDPKCDALGAANKLIVAPGLLAGSTAPNSSRTSVGAKSPLTGGIKEANVGGPGAMKLGKLGVWGIIVEGDPAGKKFVLKIDKDGASLVDGSAFWGMANYDCADALRKQFGEKVTSFQIGPAGEMGYRNSSIACTDPDGNPARHAGRGGLGAVMGARGLKAIVVDDAGTERPALVDADRFNAARKTIVAGAKEHPLTGQGLRLFGTPAVIGVMSEFGGLPTHNFTKGRFDDAAKIGGEAVAQSCADRGGQATHACMPGCVVSCSNVMVDADGQYVTSGLEYETIGLIGSNCDVGDLDDIARMDRLCDDIGMDTIETGGTFGVAMEGGVLPWGDGKRMIEIMDNDVRKGTELGKKLAHGADFAAEAFGVKRSPTVKHQTMAAYDPRSAFGIGVTYATSPMGADHTAGYAIGANVLGVGGTVPPQSAEGQADLSRTLQQATAGIFDSTGLCLFLAFPALDQPETFAAIPELLAGGTGIDLDIPGWFGYGIKILENERAFNKAAGLTAADDRLPGFFKTEKLEPLGTTFDVPDSDLDAVFGG